MQQQQQKILVWICLQEVCVAGHAGASLQSQHLGLRQDHQFPITLGSKAGHSEHRSSKPWAPSLGMSSL